MHQAQNMSREPSMTSWRERLRLVNPTVARDAALHGLPDQIGDLSPVAVVRNDINDTSGRVWAQVRSELVFRPEFEPALDGLSGFSHLFVIGWMGEVSDEGRALLGCTLGRRDTPLKSVFATRTAHRAESDFHLDLSLESVDGTSPGSSASTWSMARRCSMSSPT